MDKYILRFDEIGKNDVPTAGGKGANLGEMTSAGIAVPPGAVLTTAAYDSFMAQNDISADNINENNAEDIRTAIRSAEMPSDIAEEILSFYRTLGENARIAVRSSATAEDLADASFAGQQETYLNVRGEDELIQRIKDCYASLWGDRAVSYRKTQGYDGKVSLAVVLQHMIESESAGVVFTKDPSGLTDDMVINASYGLGEAVVSGMVSPDEYRCDRRGYVKKAVIGSKEIKIVYGECGTEKVSVSDDMRSAQVLSADMIKRLADSALEVEEHYGHPMDIEWAVTGGNIYILQARNITTIRNDAKTFTDKDFESLPKVKPAKGKMRESIMFNMEKLPKPYFPLDHDFGDNVGRQKQRLLSEAGIDMKEMTPIDDNGISSFGIGGFSPNMKVFGIPAVIKAMKDDKSNIRHAEEAMKDCKKRLDDEKDMSLEDIQSVGAALERMKALIGDTAYARFRYAIFPQVIENISLEKQLKKLDKSLSSLDLMEGLSYVTADINRDMSAIADFIRSDKTMTERVMKTSFAELAETEPELKERFDAFLKKYGSRTDLNCYCFISKSWNDDPDRFLGTLRTLVRNESFRIPQKEESKAKFLDMMQKMHGLLGDKKYNSFRNKVKAVRYYHYFREATQYLWESEFEHCRKLLCRCAELLGMGYNDLLYLFADELAAVCRQGKADEYIGLIEKRKEKRPLAEAYWSRCMELSLSSDSDRITGVSGSAGKAAGKVCIVSSPAEFDKLEQGDILVCTYTDPEWTPLFTLASAVVVDTGGTLSHAAIVAREYKIPAVLATGNATKLLHDGDMVIVDGTNGRVSVTSGHRTK